MNKYSAKIKIKSDRVRKDGTSLLYLQVIINQVVKKISLEIHWPKERFYEDPGKFCLPRAKVDKDANDNNMLLRDAVARANEVFKIYRLGNRNLTMEAFLLEFHSEMSKECFIEYASQKLQIRYRKKEIKERTFKNQTGTLRELRLFQALQLGKLTKKQVQKIREEIKGTRNSSEVESLIPRLPLPFNSFTRDLAKDFDNYLKNICKSAVNTRFGRHRDIKTYLAMAVQDHIKFENPYNFFKVKTADGSWHPLTRTEVNALYQYYLQTEPGADERQILRKFLFGCNTGLRISDLNEVAEDWVIESTLVFRPFKGRDSEKTLRMPLSKVAKQLFAEALEEDNAGKVFISYTEQHENRVLQTIARKLGIKTHVHYHIARETFATIYLEMGGKLEVLQQYLGHARINTTMRYVKIRENLKREEISKVDLMFD